MKPFTVLPPLTVTAGARMRAVAAAAALALLLGACGSTPSSAPPAAGASTTPAGGAASAAPATPAGSAAAPSPAGSAAAPSPAAAKPSGAPAKPAASPGAPSPAAAKPSGLTKVTAAFTTLTSASSIPWVSKGAGYFQQQGLDVDLQFLSPATATQGILAGQIDLSTGSPGNVATADAQGADIVIVGSSYEGPIFAIVARPQIKTLQDLKGKKISATQRGATSDLLVREILKNEGLGGDAVTVVYIPETAAQVAALQSGAVDAAILGEPTTSVAVSQGGHIIWDPASQPNNAATGSVSMSVLMVKRPWLAGHRETVKSFLRANMQAAKLMKTDPATAAKYTAPYLKLDDQKVLQSGVEAIAKITPDDMSFSMQGLQSILDTTATTNPAVAKLKPQDIIDLSPIQEIKAGK